MPALQLPMSDDEIVTRIKFKRSIAGQYIDPPKHIIRPCTCEKPLFITSQSADIGNNDVREIPLRVRCADVSCRSSSIQLTLLISEDKIVYVAPEEDEVAIVTF